MDRMRALLSVADTTGIETLARGLVVLGYELLSTGGTARGLAEAGIDVRSVSDVTGFPEILGGRVKTLHPTIHGGILARRGDEGHMEELARLGIEPIDLVVCNLYPFVEAIDRPDATLESALEEIDIGGVTLLRAAAKNFADVIVIVRPQDYPLVLTELEMTGACSLATRKHLAAVAFQHTASYDTAIAEYLRQGTADALFPPEVTLGLRRLQTLRYGENPHQAAALYAWGCHGKGLVDEADTSANTGATSPDMRTIPTVAGAHLLHGKELSFNNLLDLDAALTAVASFTSPTTVVIKHTNPCGLACGDSLAEAYRRAHAGDPVAAYGGVLGFNRQVDQAVAEDVAQIFYEAIIAPGYSPAALEILTRKKNLRLLATGTPVGPSAVAMDTQALVRMDLRRVSGGLLLQTPDIVSEHEFERQVVTEREPTLEEVTDLLFAWKAVQHVKSNAIVLAKKLTVVGVGAGQMSRVASVQIAVDRSSDRARGAVMASDAYFPFSDGVEVAAKAGITAIIQPGGSIRDDESIRMANRYGMAMIVTGKRHFRH
jgi:phosphoribosylaminoimidazolecarboxamide formyltransferase/IMP cyclohydrolase